MYYALRAYFDNGGGPCYIFSFGGGYPSTEPASEEEKYYKTGDATSALIALEKIDEVTLLVFPDKGMLAATGYQQVVQQALTHAGKMKDRFALLDVVEDSTASSLYTTPEGFFRDKSGTGNLAYGAAYYPGLKSSYSIEGKVIKFLQQNTSSIGPMDGFSLDDLLDFLEKGIVYEDSNSTNTEMSDANSAFTKLQTVIVSNSHPLHSGKLPDFSGTPAPSWPIGTSGWPGNFDITSGNSNNIISQEAYAYYLLKSIFNSSFEAKLKALIAEIKVELPCHPLCSRSLLSGRSAARRLESTSQCQPE